MVCIEIPQADTDEVGENEVAVTSETRAETCFFLILRVREKGGFKDPESGERLKHLGARRGTAGCLCRKPARTGLVVMFTTISARD